MVQERIYSLHSIRSEERYDTYKSVLTDEEKIVYCMARGFYYPKYNENKECFGFSEISKCMDEWGSSDWWRSTDVFKTLRSAEKKLDDAFEKKFLQDLSEGKTFVSIAWISRKEDGPERFFKVVCEWLTQADEESIVGRRIWDEETETYMEVADVHHICIDDVMYNAEEMYVLTIGEAKDPSQNKPSLSINLEKTVRDRLDEGNLCLEEEWSS